jgi:hypothetical protein
VRELRLSSLVEISLPQSSIDLGIFNLGQTKNTSDGGAASPFLLQNDGNCRVNISINATPFFDVNQTASSNYRFKVDNNTGEEGSFSWLDSITDWTNMPIVSRLLSIVNLDWINATDSAEVDLEVTFPADEEGFDKNTTVAFESEFNEVYT